METFLSEILFQPAVPKMNKMIWLKNACFTYIFLFFAGIPQFILAAENEVRLPSAISNVTVFLNQAQITRVAKVSLQPGVTNLVFDRVSPFINLNSIQVRADNSIIILSVSQRNNFLKNEDKPAFILEIEDTLSQLKYQLDMLKIRRESFQLEKDVMNANKQIGGSNTGVKTDDLEDALNLFRRRTQEIGEELIKLTQTEMKLQKIQSKFQSQLNEYFANENSAVEILVTVKTLTAINNANIEWSYLVNNASWKPFYDIRVKDTHAPLQLVSRAYIRQATRENWNNVILKLSTANPNESGVKPELIPNNLHFNEYNLLEMGRSGGVKASREMLTSTPASTSPPDESPFNSMVEQTDANIEFNVTSAYSIPSDNNPHQVDLTVSTLEAKYAYAAVPRLDKDAFVTARVSGNDLVNQISGEANVYFDGTLTGKSYISGTTNDSMLLSLGRDKRIQIQRVMLKDFCSKSFTGGSKKELNTWEINVRNTRKEPVELVIEDQVPVSGDKEIEVKLINTGDARFDETTGKLTWNLKLEPEKSTSVRFSFEVKYPKDKTISIY